MARLLGDAKALMLRGHGAVVVGQSIREVCMLALFLEESARLQTDAMRLGTPLFMERDEAEKIAKRTFKPSSSNGPGTILRQMRRLILSLAWSPGLIATAGSTICRTRNHDSSESPSPA